MRQAEYVRLDRAEETMWWYRALHNRVLQQLAAAQLPPGAMVLDAGCGTGGMMKVIRRARSDLYLLGLEYNPTAAARAVAKSGFGVASGSVNGMPFPDGTFDAIISLDVLCHGGVEPAGAVAEMSRCLKVGGTLILNLPAYQWMMSSHDHAVSNVRRFTRSSANRMLADKGLDMEAVGYWNSLLFPLMLAHRVLGGSRSHSDVHDFPWWQERLFGRVLAFEAALRACGFTLPFGGSLMIRARKSMAPADLPIS